MYASIKHTFFCKQDLASKNFMINVHKINCMYFILFQLRVNISDIFPPCSFSEINIYLFMYLHYLQLEDKFFHC